MIISIAAFFSAPPDAAPAYESRTPAMKQGERENPAPRGLMKKREVTR